VVDGPNDVPEYETRFLAFIDVLGWSALLKQSATDVAARRTVHAGARTMVGIAGIATRANAFRLPPFITGTASGSIDARVSHFSDTFVLSMPDELGGDGAFLFVLTGLIKTMLAYGHYTRGAVVRGLVHHSPNALYGPALVEA
jgi:hypothetical protein